MKSVNHIFLCLIFPIISGCQISYFLKSATGQLSLLNKRVPIEKALQDPKITESEKSKIRLAQEARIFAYKVGLKKTDNYSEYVNLEQPYVTYVVSAAPQWELQHYKWKFPIVGEVPYKGYFKEQDAKDEEVLLRAQELDTYLRGVSAYSTLGWFRDPLLSSMLKYSDYNLVNTIIHETVHATLYIKSSADFNERLAVFIGNKATEMFYKEKEGPNSETLQKVKLENEDEVLFSGFITEEMNDLEKWYKNQNQKNETQRKERLALIQSHFKEQLLPRLKTDAYKYFSTVPLNNARLLVYKTYVSNLQDFEILFQKSHSNILEFLNKCRFLEKEEKPEEALKKLIALQ